MSIQETTAPSQIPRPPLLEHFQVLHCSGPPRAMDLITRTNNHGATASARGRLDLLSTRLPRHDNDGSHITGIKIMPTYKEVASGAPPYLPDADPASWHLSGVSGRFDRLFRLLREESVGQIRDACREVLQAVRGPGLEAYKRQRTSTHFDVCDDAKIHSFTVHEQDGLNFIVALKQPEQVRHMTDRQRRDWWEHCNRFRRGTLVCFLDHAGHILHFVVPNSATRLPACSAAGTFRHNYSLSGDREQTYVTLKLVDSSQTSNALCYTSTRGTHYFLDFPDVRLASFKYTLESLQYHYQSPRPNCLISLLSPGPSIPQRSPPVAKPGYARAPGFAFNLGPLMQNQQPFHFPPTDAPTLSEARSLAEMRPDQAMALLKSLSCEVALVGGLPESGKSYLAMNIIKVLLHNREIAGIGPILLVFHDDAALDRMVGLLLDDGIESVVRMGGPSNSRRLQELSLPATSYIGMDEEERQAEGLMKEFRDKLWSDLLRELRDGRTYEATRTNVEYEDIRLDLHRCHDNSRRKILQDAHVVAATTTELARYPELLQPMHAKVLLCDDADKFQESHILTAILTSTEHIILIGNDIVRNERLQGINLEGVLDSSNTSFFQRLINSPLYRGSRSCHLHNLPPTAEPSQLCGRNLPDCAHSCQRPCHGDSECGPCEQPCDVRCSHARCERLCREPCIPCTEDHCASVCPHSQCTMPCAAPCNWVPCSRRCALPLDCGHQCPSLCGEACPDSRFCQTCGPEDVLMATMMSSPGMCDYRDIDLAEDPCIFPRCGHFETMSFMDQHMRIQDFYELEDGRLPSSIKGLLRPLSMHKAPCCTRCQGSLREICRYGRIIRGPMIDEPLREFLAWRNGKFCELIDRFTRSVPGSNPHMAYRGLRNTTLHHQDQPVELNGNIWHQLLALNSLVGDGSYEGLAILFSDTRKFSFGELRRREEAFRNMFGSRRRGNEGNNSTAHSALTDRLHEPQLQLYGDLFGMDLFLRCNIAVLDDFLRLWNRDPAASTSAVSHPTIHPDLKSNFGASQLFIRQAREANLHIIAAQGHVYFAWYCGFALSVGENASAREQRPVQALARESEFPESRGELRRSAEEHLATAEELHNISLHASRRLKDAIEATKNFVRSGNLGSLRVPRTLWYTNVQGMFDGDGPWYVCGNGHAFMDVRQPSRFLGQLRCKDCGVIVAGRKDSPEEEPNGTTSDVAAPPQGEDLIEI